MPHLCILCPSGNNLRWGEGGVLMVVDLRGEVKLDGGFEGGEVRWWI